MTITARRLFQFALLVAGSSTACGRLTAQQLRLDLGDITELADVVLDEVLPPDRQINRIPVRRRTTLFDHRRTLEAFGYSTTQSALTAQLRLHRSVQDGSESVLTNCSRWGGRGQCAKLGWAIYVWIEPLSITAADARVYVHTNWAARDPRTFEEGITATRWSALFGPTTEVFLQRTPEGNWRYLSTGITIGD